MENKRSMDEAIGNFLLDYSKCRYWYHHKNNPKNTRVAILLETRSAFFLPHVIRNVACTLGKTWNLHIIHGISNGAFLKRELSGWDIQWSQFYLSHMTPKVYNGLLKSREFWEMIHEEHILIFQLDSVLFSPIPETFLQFSMIGAPCGMEGNTWNGGLSLRKRSDMIRVIQENKDEIVKDPEENEDVFFSRLLRHSDWANLPSKPVSIKFSAESNWIEGCVGGHGTDKYYLPSSVWKQLYLHIRI